MVIGTRAVLRSAQVARFSLGPDQDSKYSRSFVSHLGSPEPRGDELSGQDGHTRRLAVLSITYPTFRIQSNLQRLIDRYVTHLTCARPSPSACRTQPAICNAFVSTGQPCRCQNCLFAPKFEALQVCYPVSRTPRSYLH